MEEINLYVFAVDGTACILAAPSQAEAQQIINIQYGFDVGVFISQHDIGEIIEINFSTPSV